jgi:hypothetical protein
MNTSSMSSLWTMTTTWGVYWTAEQEREALNRQLAMPPVPIQKWLDQKRASEGDQGK